jgi:hypothetical protein
MAFTGVAVVTKVSDREFRITGLSLANGAAGTIGLDGGTGDVDLVAGWAAYAAASLVTLQDAIRVTIGLAGVAAVAPAIQVVKTGTTVADFLATLTNGGAAPSGDMEIYVEFH